MNNRLKKDFLYKNHLVFQDICTKLITHEIYYRPDILPKIYQDRSTIAFNFHRNNQFLVEPCMEKYMFPVFFVVFSVKIH